MKNDAWRVFRHLIFSLIGALISLPGTSWADTTVELASYYKNAYVQGRDLVRASPTPLDTSSIATHLDLQSDRKAALSGSAFLATVGTIVRLAGVQSRLSSEPLEYPDFVATCAMVSFAATTATIADEQHIAGSAFPCHKLGRSPGHPMVRYAEWFFVDGDTARSLSEVLISKGVAFAFADSAGQPVSPEYSQMEDVARATRAGIWASANFLRPYGERYRANPTRH